MATNPPGTIAHDQAAQLLRTSPAELKRLVDDGVIPRVSPGAYHPGAIIAAYIEHLRAEPERRNKTPRQAEIAEHLDISDRRLRELLTEWGLDHKQTSLTELRLRYIRKLREEAAGRQGDGDLDLVQERAALARAQRIGQDVKNAVAMGTYAPVDLLSTVLATASQAIAQALDQLPARLRRTVDELPQGAIDQIAAACADARNTWVRDTSALITQALQMDDDDDPPATETPDP